MGNGGVASVPDTTSCPPGRHSWQRRALRVGCLRGGEPLLPRHGRWSRRRGVRKGEKETKLRVPAGGWHGGAKKNPSARSAEICTGSRRSQPPCQPPQRGEEPDKSRQWVLQLLNCLWTLVPNSEGFGAKDRRLPHIPLSARHRRPSPRTRLLQPCNKYSRTRVK